ncbi:MAG: hypothetical protein KAW41_02680 [Candidatus Diapherotrites archaeon]|nr:hypothetical protein [Candidatus Diapherotrites archaeon]
MIPQAFKQQAVIFYVALFAFSYFLLVLDTALAFVFAGSAFVLLAPFLITERHSIPINNVFVSVGAAMAMIFIGGVFWLMATML